jgi:hypothetical protein
MIRHVFGSLTLAGFLLLVATTGPSPAQDKLFPKEGAPPAFLGGVKEKPDAKHTSRLSELKNGSKALAEDADFNKEVLAKAANWYVYRLTWDQYHGQGTEEKDKSAGPPLTMNDLVREAQNYLWLESIRKKVQLKPPQVEYIHALGKEMNRALRDVFSQNSKPIVRVNAARMLAGIAETGQGEVADTAILLIQNPQESDAVKLYALRALKELFALPASAKTGWNQNRETQSIQAVQAYLTRKIDTLPTDPQERDAINFVRREAVRALAQTRYATVPTIKDASGRTALWLLKVARKDGFTPPPSVSEQIEAAMGVCELTPAKDLQMDYIAHHIGFAVVDFVNEYSKQRAGGEGAGMPWKLYSYRVTNALNTLSTNAGNNKYVANVITQCLAAIKPMEVGKEATAAALEDWLKANAPASKSVYAGVADAVIAPTLETK